MRKQREAPPPGMFIRSKGGTPARLIKTTEFNEHDEWLYRLSYNDKVKGEIHWSVQQLLESGVTFMDERPDDLSEEA